jgi:hypothetical protein
MAKGEILENFESFDRCHEALIDPDQRKVDVSPSLKTERIEKAAENEESLSLYKETIIEKVKQMVPIKPVREERIKVKTFKIDKNSFCIEWNI